MARNAHIHTAASPRHDAVVPGAIRRSFEASIAAAKKHAERTGEDLVDLLDRMDAADPRTCGARNRLLSGSYGATPKGQRARAWFAVDAAAGLQWIGDEPRHDGALTA